MTNRLHILERERERLEAVLAEDPHWQALCKTQRHASATGRPQALSADAVAGLQHNETFASYLKIVKAIEQIGTTEAAAQSDTSTPDSTEQVFRTRLNVKPTPAPAASESPSDAPEPARRIDDLTAIRQIDRQTEKALNALGVFAYQTIAEWNRYDVRAARDALDLGKRIWRENWIEQAALLQMRNPQAADVVTAVPDPANDLPEPEPTEPDTPPTEAYADLELAALPEKAPDTPEPVVIDAPSGPMPVKQPPADADATLPATESVAAISPTPEPLTPPTQPAPPPRETYKVGRRARRLPAPAARRFSYLFGVSDQMAEALRSAGVTSLSDIAVWSRADVKWFRAILGNEARISQDQWIEQAALLSKGIWTQHALRVVNGEERLLVEAPAPLQIGAPASLPANPAPTTIARPPEPEAVTDEPAAQTEPDIAATVPPSPAPDEATVVDVQQPAATIEQPSEQIASRDEQPTDESTENVETVEQPTALTATFAKQLSQPMPIDHALRAPGPSNENDAPAPTSEQPEEITPPDIAKPPSNSKTVPPPTILVERFNPMRGLTTSIALGKIKRPPPDLGSRPRQITTPQTTPPPIPKPRPEPSVAVEPPPQPPAVAVPAPEPPPPIVNESSPEKAVAETTPDLNLADDWHDAEALMVRRAELAAILPEQTTQSPPALPPATPAAATPRQSDEPRSISTPDDEPEDAQSWGDEAEVVIVSRPRATAPTPAVPKSTASPIDQARERIGAATDFIARRIQNTRSYDDDEIDHASTNASYRDTFEEASVTIIRAESSQEKASSVVPDEIANDADAPAEPEKKPGVRAIGSRFLKALTGD